MLERGHWEHLHFQNSSFEAIRSIQNTWALDFHSLEIYKLFLEIKILKI